MRRRKQLEVLFGVSQGVVSDQRGYVREFRGLGAEKFTARWSVEEEVGHSDRGSARQGCIIDTMDFAAGYFDAGADRVIPG